MEQLPARPPQPAIEVYSRQIQTLMGYMPGFWARWSITLMCLLLVAFALLLSQVHTRQQIQLTLLHAPPPLPALTVPGSVGARGVPGALAVPGTVRLVALGELSAAAARPGGTCTYMVPPVTPGTAPRLVIGRLVATHKTRPYLVDLQLEVLRVSPTPGPYTSTLLLTTVSRSMLQQSFSTIFRDKGQ